MAEVYRPESDDRLSPYPRAPPPSPEAQHRTLGGMFEFPRGAFEGFGIDLRRRDFDFDEIDNVQSPVHEPTTVRRSSPKRAASSDTDNSDCEQPGSPMKRMCSAPSTMPNSFELPGFDPSLLATTSSISGEGGLLQASSSGGIRVSIPNFSELAASKSRSPEHVCPQSHSHSTSPTLFQQQPQGTSPYSIPPRSNGSVTPTHKPTSHPHDTSHLLSKSFDLHHVQSHFPTTLEITPPPEVRPARSRTLDTTSYTHDNSTLRTRKVSLKRNYGELESDPNLQFAFDYSYSSTGSSGESDWIVIESDLSSYPQGKKACCQQEPPSAAAAAAMSNRRHSPTVGPSSRSPLHSTDTTTTAITTANPALMGTNGLSQENILLRSQEVATSHLGHSSSPLVVLKSNNGADLSSFPGGSAASNGSGSHSPLHTQLGMISEAVDLSSSAELHNASSAGCGQMPTADAALAERSRAEFVPQWSMEMMDCGDYSMRLDSIDSMDCGQVDTAVTMQSLGGIPEGSSSDFDNTPLFTGSFEQQQGNPHHVQGHMTSPHHLVHTTQAPGHDMVVKSLSSEANFSGSGGGGVGGGMSSGVQAATRHSFIENYFMTYHNQSVPGGGGGMVGGEQAGTFNAEASSESRLNFSKSL